MQIFSTITDFRQACANASRPLGLVATMGALHKGHIALIQQSTSECAATAATLFVNPSQFGPREDFRNYPANLQSDLKTFEREGIQFLFAPTIEEVYPPNFDTRVQVGKLGARLEGKFRPGHFEGVATIVCKLLSVSKPTKAYFGQKDVQQSLVIQRMNADLNLGAEIVVVPTVRDSDGLALSSRNLRLDPTEREAATVLYRTLTRARELVNTGTIETRVIRRTMRKLLREESLARVDYVSISDATSLEELEIVDRPALALVAARIGETRLIDNLPLHP